MPTFFRRRALHLLRASVTRPSSRATLRAVLGVRARFVTEGTRLGEGRQRVRHAISVTALIAPTNGRQFCSESFLEARSRFLALFRRFGEFVNYVRLRSRLHEGRVVTVSRRASNGKGRKGGRRKSRAVGGQAVTSDSCRHRGRCAHRSMDNVNVSVGEGRIFHNIFFSGLSVVARLGGHNVDTVRSNGDGWYRRRVGPFTRIRPPEDVVMSRGRAGRCRYVARASRRNGLFPPTAVAGWIVDNVKGGRESEEVRRGVSGDSGLVTFDARAAGRLRSVVPYGCGRKGDGRPAERLMAAINPTGLGPERGRCRTRRQRCGTTDGLRGGRYVRLLGVCVFACVPRGLTLGTGLCRFDYGCAGGGTCFDGREEVVLLSRWFSMALRKVFEELRRVVGGVLGV